MIYRDQGFLAVIRFGSSPPPSSVSKLSLFLRRPVCRRSSLLTGEGDEVSREGAKSYDIKKAWSSTYHSILSGRVSGQIGHVLYDTEYNRMFIKIELI